ncbi:hypothetical protein NDU88_002394 [Pleurodeles waltl]|uniref:Uncharacterized protein n=1 Tax=Pleurodeles waltl TaxID=8319 RepID=A0AAV7M2B3_PLEWA|nr:hypothetical protein NDU88_002394 [Pleurodeles waltl]
MTARNRMIIMIRAHLNDVSRVDADIENGAVQEKDKALDGAEPAVIPSLCDRDNGRVAKLLNALRYKV